MRVLTIGTFDPLHSGHLGLFRQCRRLAGTDGHLTVGINADEFVTEYKQTTPLIPYQARADIIGGLRLVDAVVRNPGGWMQELVIRNATPDILVVGDDWARKDYLSQIGVTQQWLDNLNIQLCYVPRTGDWSSTALKTLHHN